MSDGYMRVVLTVIAVALVMLAVKAVLPVEEAWGQQGQAVLPVRIVGVDLARGMPSGALLPVEIRSIRDNSNHDSNKVGPFWHSIKVREK